MNVKEIRHPLIRHKLGLMRRSDISTKNFRELAQEVAALLTYEATQDMAVETHTIQGWCGDVEVEKLSGKKVTVVPILRAGLGMLDGVLSLVPSAKVSVIGLARNEETLEADTYLEKLVGELNQRMALIIDPMLATGGSMVATIDMLKKAGAREIRALVLVAAPEGIQRVNDAHPDVQIYTASVDQRLNEHGYIIPGLGDAGDKILAPSRRISFDGRRSDPRLAHCAGRFPDAVCGFRRTGTDAAYYRHEPQRCPVYRRYRHPVVPVHHPPADSNLPGLQLRLHRPDHVQQPDLGPAHHTRRSAGP